MKNDWLGIDEMRRSTSEKERGAVGSLSLDSAEHFPDLLICLRGRASESIEAEAAHHKP